MVDSVSTSNTLALCCRECTTGPDITIDAVNSEDD